MNILQAISNYSEIPLSSELLLHELKSYSRPFDKIDELVKKGVLLQIKRGLYLPGPNIQMQGPEPFLLANHLYGPSYVSLDAALSHWGLIPERVYRTTSMSTKKSKVFNTAVGAFRYTKLSLPYYSYGVKQVSLTSKQTVLMASPEKALCDKIITTTGLFLRSKKQTLAYLIEDLRIEKEDLQPFDIKTMKTWISDSPKSTSIHQLIETIASFH